MYSDLLIARELVYNKCGFTLTNLKKDSESLEYHACQFNLNGMEVKYRASKITPTKTGQFVTIWKRNNDGVTEPFNIADPIDLLIVSARSGQRFGQFIIPKSILLEKRIISGNNKEGKRGIRVYAPWDIVNNNQAEKTKRWQNEYFLDMTNEDSIDLNQAKSLIKQTIK